MQQIRIGVLGGYRGSALINYAEQDDRVRVTAICDKNEKVLEMQKQLHPDSQIRYVTEFEELLSDDVDVVVVANYATCHAPFAIRAMEAGKDVFSEVLPVQTMKEAVELCETVEKTGKIYAYGENNCFMGGAHAIRDLYRAGKLGEIEYAEGEYIHDLTSIWPSITYGDETHWRNHMYATFYCTHSIGPMIHISGLRPVSVTGFESTMMERQVSIGALGGLFGMEIITMENGAIFKSVHGNLRENSTWYSVYGSRGRAETGREDAYGQNSNRYLHVRLHGQEVEHHDTFEEMPVDARTAGHGGADYLIFKSFFDRLSGDESAEIIDVYEALDMFLPGLLAYRSVLNGNVPMAIPNFRNKEEREAYRNDTACVDAAVAGDQLLPSFSKGNPDIDPAIYEMVKEQWEAADMNSDYAQAAFHQGEKQQ